MDAEDLELFSRSIRHAAEAAGGSSGFDAGAFDASLADLGWHDAVADFPRESISTLFSIQGETNATSSALHRVVAWALTGSPSAPGAILPRLGSWQPPAREAGDQVQVNGLANTALVEAGEVGQQAMCSLARPHPQRLPKAERLEQQEQANQDQSGPHQFEAILLCELASPTCSRLAPAANPLFVLQSSVQSAQRKNASSDLADLDRAAALWDDRSPVCTTTGCSPTAPRGSRRW